MSMDACPLCGEPNSHTAALCRRCNYRLPWADSLEGVPEREIKRSPTEQALDGQLKALGLLPERTVACRFCEQKIAVDDKQCPHCGKWLVAAFHDFDMDPWQPDYDDRATKGVSTIGPRTGCFSIIIIICLPIVCWALLAYSTAMHL